MSLLHRTYSSPNLSDRKYRHEWESQQERYGYETEEDEFYVIGDRVYVDGFRPASVAYFGEVEFGTGDWVGVVLDEPTGNHNGRLHGRQYFQCADKHGLFVRPLRVSRMLDSAMGSSAASSRLMSPQTGQGRASKSPACSSTMSSYFYDDDYRQDRAPSAASLAKKLRSISKDSGHSTIGSSPSSQIPSSQRLSPVRSPTRHAGILKRPNQQQQELRSQSTEPLSRYSSGRTRYSHLGSRLAATPSPSVFNFRPQRARLDEYDELSASRKSVDLSNESAQVGDRVIFRSDRGETSGTLRFLGETNFATGDWAGIELDDPSGKNDGAILGERYFHCEKNYGLFVPAVRVRKQDYMNPFSLLMEESRNSERLPDYLSRFALSPLSSRRKTRPATPINSDRMSPYSNEFSSPASSANNPSSSYLDAFSQFFSQPGKLKYIDAPYDNLIRERPKFDEADIEYQLKMSLRDPKPHRAASTHPISSHFQQPASQAKSVEYTFSSSKYGGNPIVRRTVTLY